MVKIGGYVTEHRFHPVRKWRFDFAWLDQSIAVEIEGGTWSGGRHTRGSGFELDCEKYNEAAAIGWTVFRFTGKMVKSGNAIQLLKEVMK
jgi:very-short-patch-repair endonuclease